MKKLLQMKFMLLLCALIVGSGTMWAEEETIASFSASVYNGGTTNEWTVTNADYATANSGYYKLISNDASIVTPNINWSDYKDITITISARKYGGPDATQGKISVSQGTTELASYSPSGTSIAASSALAITPADGTITISCPGASSSKGCGVQSIVIKGTKKASTSPLDFITLSGTYPTSFTEGDEFSHEGMTVTATYEDESTADVTSSASFTGYDMTVLGQNQTVTVSYSEGEVTRTAEYTIIVNALPKHSVTWSVNGTESEPESYKEGAAITFPANPADIEGKSFVGWTETAISGTTDETPTFVTSATMGNADITYYAVFADVTPGTSTSITDHLTTSTFGSPSSYGNWSGKKATDGSDAVYAGNSTTYNNTAIQLRAQSPSGIITTTSGGKAKKVTVTWNSGTTTGRTLDIYGKNTAYSAASDLYGNASGTKIGSIVFDGESTELTISGDYEFIGLRSNSGAMYINQIDIDWETGTPDTYSGYCTTVAADTREEAGLSFTESTASVEWYVADQYTGQNLTNPNNVSPITWTSSNEGVATVENGTVTVLALGETTIKASFDGDNNYKKGEASYTLTVQDSRTALELSFDPESVEVNVNETVAIPTLNGNQGNGTVTYASDDETIATVTEDANTSLVVTGLAEGTTTITATVAATNEYKEGTATFTVTVIDPNKKGSVNNPYTVDEARAAIDAGTGVTEVYATGIVSEIVTAFNSQYGNITYNISADGLTTSDQLQAYRGKGIGGADFTSEDDIKVGDVVVIYGDLKKHNNSIYEFDSGNQLVSLKLVAPTFYPEAGGVASGTEITISDLHTTATIYYTTNGDTPTTSSTKYNSENKPVITAATTIKAIAVKEGYTPSDVVTASYTILSPAATPTFSPEGGIYTSAQNVTISSDTENAIIYYTLDGSDPTTSSIEYTGAIVVDETVTIKAIAVKEGMANSAVASATYTMNIPSIVFDGDQNPYDVPCTAGNTNIHYVASNITGTVSLVICDANGGETTYDWFSAELYGDSYVKVQWQANPDAENSRTAYFKLTDGITTSEIFALTQAKYVPDYATLPFEFNGGKSDFASKTGLTQEGLGSDYNATNNPTTKLKFDSTDDWMILKINEIPGTLTFDIKGNNFSGGTFKVQTSADGVTYTDLKKYTSFESNTQSEKFDNLSADVRYIKWIYTEKSNGNVGLGNITLGNTMAVAIAAACTDGTKCYSTFSSSKPFVVSEDLTVSEIGIEDGTMNVVNYATGETVPANTGVMVSATDGGNYVVNISKEAGTSVLDAENRLRPTGDNGLTATEMNSAEPETCKFYRLTMHNDTKLGFWWGADGGDSFAIVANKAYLAVPASVAGARNGFAFGDDATGISNVNVNENVNGSVFDLQGRKVSTPGKGLYIVNGKKVVIK